MEIANVQRVVEGLREKGKTLCSAESCTGGWIAKAVTDIAGASRVFRGGVVSYTNDVKRVVLGVSPQSLEREGAVSEPVARQMAEGARLLLHADIAVSTTGEAGPEGGTVGLVYIALSAAEGTWCNAYRFDGDRTEVRRAAVEQALGSVLEYLETGTVSAHGLFP